MIWPPLPRSGFITGRPAIEADIAADNALFVLRSGGQLVGQHLPLDVPQYVIHRDENGQRWAAILIQAEAAGDMQFAGVRHLDGTTAVATLEELDLLGTTTPDVDL
jgi:hypothetical protein